MYQQLHANEAQNEMAAPGQIPTAFPSKDWHAVHVRARHEKKIALSLEQRGVEVYLPLVSQIRQWSDRKTKVEIPLFSCYVFVRVSSMAEIVNALIQCPGFLSILGNGNPGSTIPEEQIERIRQLIDNNVEVEECPFIKVGQRVRVIGGTLDGVEGILMAKKQNQSLVISVDAIQRSMAISISGYRVEPV